MNGTCQFCACAAVDDAYGMLLCAFHRDLGDDEPFVGGTLPVCPNDAFRSWAADKWLKEDGEMRQLAICTETHTTAAERLFLRAGDLKLPVDRPLIRKACDHIEGLEAELEEAGKVLAAQVARRESLRKFVISCICPGHLGTQAECIDTACVEARVALEPKKP